MKKKVKKQTLSAAASAAMAHRRELLKVLSYEDLSAHTPESLHREDDDGDEFEDTLRLLKSRLENRVRIDRLLAQLLRTPDVDMDTYESALLTFAPLAKLARAGGSVTGIYHDLRNAYQWYDEEENDDDDCDDEDDE